MKENIYGWEMKFREISVHCGDYISHPNITTLILGIKRKEASVLLQW